MLNLEAYINRAIDNQELQSDRHLGRVLGVSPSTVAIWRAGKSLPTDETMVKLAGLAKVSKEQALLELSYWRAEGEAKDTYESLIKRLGVTAAAVTLVILSGFVPTTANANSNIMSNDVVYYGN